jgi:hypothetical protein
MLQKSMAAGQPKHQQNHDLSRILLPVWRIVQLWAGPALFFPNWLEMALKLMYWLQRRMCGRAIRGGFHLCHSVTGVCGGVGRRLLRNVTASSMAAGITLCHGRFAENA